MIIELLDGTRFDTADYDLKRLFHFIPSATIDHTSQSVEGRPDIILSSQLNNRIIRVEFLYEAADIYDYYLLRDELNDLFMRTEPFYIIFKREPYKRWLVKTSSQFEVPPAPHMNSFVVEFLTFNGYSESTFATPQLDSKEWDVDKFYWNGNIQWDENISYRFFETNNFVVNNLGDLDVDPTQNFLQITVNANALEFLEIRNITTGDVFRYNGTLTINDLLNLEGIRSFKNQVSVFSDTNRQLISLKKGINVFEVIGGTINSIGFNFRFLYK